MNLFIPRESQCIILSEFAMHVTLTRIAREDRLFAISLSGLVGVRLDVIDRDVKVHCGFPATFTFA